MHLRQETPELAQCEFDTDELIVRLDITLAADARSIAGITAAILALTMDLKCAAGKELGIEIPLREALACAIRHGCNRDATKQVQCIVACDPTRGMIIVIRHPAEGFDPATIPGPLVGQNVYLDHGRGIYLISQLMDRAWYERNATEIYMIKK